MGGGLCDRGHRTVHSRSATLGAESTETPAGELIGSEAPLGGGERNRDMAIRSRRLRLLESLRVTLSDKLHSQVFRVARSCGRHTPENTSAIYAMAVAATPDLLDQLLLVHQRVREERNEIEGMEAPSTDDIERKRMLSAVRATVDRAAHRIRV